MSDKRQVVKTIDAAAKLHGLATYTELVSALQEMLAMCATFDEDGERQTAAMDAAEAVIARTAT